MSAASFMTVSTACKHLNISSADLTRDNIQRAWSKCKHRLSTQTEVLEILEKAANLLFEYVTENLEVSEILNGCLFLGSVNAAYDIELLARKEITHILSVATEFHGCYCSFRVAKLGR